MNVKTATDEISIRPTVSFLSREDKEKIHQAVVDILSDIGMKIFHDEALELLKEAGCFVDDNQLVKIPGELVLQAIENAPNNVVIYDREGSQAMDLGGHRSYFGTGSDLIFSLDSQTMKRHRCILDDVARAAKVADALPNIDFIMSFAHPSDFPPRQAYLRSFQTMAAHSTKPMVCTAENRRDLSEMWEIARILRNGENELETKPLAIYYGEPVSPLQFPFESVDKLLFCAEKSFPAIYSPAPIAGSTAPMTIAGHVAQGLAECFCGLVIHQLKGKGAPFIMGMGPAVLDMSTAQCSYNAPEYLLAYLTLVEMSHYYNLPNWGYAGTSDSQIPDEQATFEAGLLTFLSALAGSNLNHDVGYLDFGRTGSLDMIVLLDEVIDQVRRICRGIPVNNDMLAIDVIREVSTSGDFLSHRHTLEHLMSTQWRPKLINRTGYDKWHSSGGTSLMGRTQEKLQLILQEHQPVPISAAQARAIQERVEQFR
ncbi:MAG: trimethylamine methyltransferase [Desulfobacterales bacterium]|nr:trimethylamine methyltransferase family protein [Deltaproteobacteria bacterium]NNL75744.1 trimethylamine methyltransferase [Desulfobacterales bacterium]